MKYFYYKTNLICCPYRKIQKAQFSCHYSAISDTTIKSKHTVAKYYIYTRHITKLENVAKALYYQGANKWLGYNMPQIKHFLSVLHKTNLAETLKTVYVYECERICSCKAAHTHVALLPYIHRSCKVLVVLMAQRLSDAPGR